MIHSIRVRGYRSLRDLTIRLGRLTIVTGENGTGKSNLYRSLWLLHEAAEGRFAESIAGEGGMPSLLWAGERRSDEPLGIRWELEHDAFHFELTCGLSPASGSSSFRTDPDIKTEAIRLGGSKGRIVAERKGSLAKVRGADRKMENLPLPVHAPESIISEVRDAARHPELAAVRAVLSDLRFYHHFRTDADSPARRAQVGSWSPVLHHDGANLAAAWQSIAESGLSDELDEAVDRAFPGSHWEAVNESDLFELSLSRPGLSRPLSARELSDGTLRYLCLIAALLTPRPPRLLVFNEPESSLNGNLLEPLAEMAARVPEDTQLLFVTHSEALTSALLSRMDGVSRRLISYEGETRLEGQGGARRVWTFDD